MIRCAALLAILPYIIGCEAGAEGPLTADGAVLHLDEHLADATVIGSEVPAAPVQSVDWDDEKLLAEWGSYEGEAKANWLPGEPAIVGPGEGAIRIEVDERHRAGNGNLSALITTPVDGWLAADWSHVVVRARTSDPLDGIGFMFGRDSTMSGDGTPVITDGQVHTYRVEVPRRVSQLGLLEWIGVGFVASAPGSLEILSISVVPGKMKYAELGGTGVTPEWRELYRRPTLFAHTPGRIEYRLRVPPGGRFDAALAIPFPDEPITFRVEVSAEAGEEVLAEEVVTDADAWIALSVDLSSWADRDVVLALEIESSLEGGIGLWGAPTVSEKRTGDAPNVILYVIDGGGADFMSLYGYARRTTSNLERLADEGIVFEYAHSNSAWTRSSTPSFLTSLHHSAVGVGNWDSIPPTAITMAEHFRRGGYQTALLTTNSWSGSLSSGGRGLDVLRERGVDENRASSAELHRNFSDWREAFHGEPYFVHFQTTDVHEPYHSVAPFAGLYVTPARRASYDAWWHDLWEVLKVWDVMRDIGDVSGAYHASLDSLGVDPRTFFSTQRDLYDETMAQQDHQIGRLVERLKASGEWDNTILIVTADHGHPAGSYSRFGRELIDPPPERWEGAFLDSYRTRVPLLIVAPGRLEGGRRILERVSLIDLLPTVLELVGLPPPEIMQGQSLVPLMTGTEGWEPRPVILEQYQRDAESDLEWGHIEVIDGRWGASLEIYPDIPDSVEFRPDGPQRAARLHDPDVPRLLLYDVLEDPLATRNVNDEHPDLVAKYTEFLERQILAHESVRQLIAPSEGQVELTPEQLETLRSLGYIQ
jgi:arylsulfatase A-like enzyme